jgi:hypothetical protein
MIILCAVGCGFTMPETVSACTIPVFRYAMTRWTPDPYDVIVFHRGNLTPSQQQQIDTLQRMTPLNLPLVNCIVRTVDLSGDVTANTQEFWQQQKTDILPWVVARYPRYAPVRGVLWAGPLTEVGLLIDSPVRKTIANRLLDGEAAVWVLLESGSKTGDDAAATLLQNDLTKLNRTLKASTPPPAPGTSEIDTEADESTVRFSMLRLPRDSRPERVLVEMLLSCEPDLREYDEPMAIPVFGRGRALYALVGKGITPANILDACVFLIEGCSCQVKAQNPGADLLMTVDWEGELLGEPGAATRPSPLREAIDETLAASPEPDESDTLGRRTILRNSLLVIAAGVLVGVVAGWILYRRNNHADR